MFIGTELGTVLTVASANDVDTYPPLVYSFDEIHTDEEALSVFAIDRFSGKVLLKKRLDYEMRQEYQLRIFASDSKYKAQSALTIHVTDENNFSPEFSQLLYQATISGKFFEQTNRIYSCHSCFRYVLYVMEFFLCPQQNHPID